jgi:hypothetical protein
MKQFASVFCGCAILVATITACKKENHTLPFRTIYYQLYTEKDFSNNQDSITFRLVIRAGRNKLFDSALSPMRIAEIPDKANKFIFRKTVPAGYERSDLTVGFLYSVKDIGESWYLDTCKVKSPEKTIEYSFQ